MMLFFNIGQEMGSKEYIQKQSGIFIKTNKEGVMFREKIMFAKNIGILEGVLSNSLMYFFSYYGK